MFRKSRHHAAKSPTRGEMVANISSHRIVPDNDLGMFPINNPSYVNAPLIPKYQLPLSKHDLLILAVGYVRIHTLNQYDPNHIGLIICHYCYNYALYQSGCIQFLSNHLIPRPIHDTKKQEICLFRLCFDKSKHNQILIRMVFTYVTFQKKTNKF